LLKYTQPEEVRPNPTTPLRPLCISHYAQGGPIVVHLSTQLHKNCNLIFIPRNSTNILVKSVSFYLDRFRRHGALKNLRLFGPSCICTCVVWCCVGGRQLPRMLQALTSVARLSFSMTFLSRDGPRLIVHTDRPPLSTRQGTGSLGHRVNGSSGSSFTSGSAGHRAIILTRCETEFFPFSKKCAKCKTYI